jgi:hypothetical protein
MLGLGPLLDLRSWHHLLMLRFGDDLLFRRIPLFLRLGLGLIVLLGRLGTEGERDKTAG